MHVNSSELDALALDFIAGVGSITQRNLIDYFGSPKAVIEASADELQQISGVGKVLSAKIIAGKSEAYKRAEKELLFVEKHQIKIYSYTDKSYPKRLRECPDAPMVFYYRGNADLDSARIVSVVGSRKATPYGRMLCEELIEKLSDYNVLVVSGLAYGIDVCAHKTSLDHRIPTVGVLGHGLHTIYPSVHRNIAVKMLDNGGLLSEFPSDTPADPKHFPQRNRIVAGLADVTVVVEAAKRGGALITAELANSYDRDVCAFPGNIGNEYSAGCNLLIKSHRAHLITSAEDLGYLMDWQPVNRAEKEEEKVAHIRLSDVEQTVYNIVKEGGMISIDGILNQSKVQPNKLPIVLLELEMKGLIIITPGKMYRVTIQGSV
ncbi:DNA-processing protein DprA [Albibacterium indicum]|uniref:DNA-processing protein DprA n=1 Tax=Albibacterium indicum TaxID=2292082 RepID=UPI000E49BEFA|nr:DNA-processing protein DprA [Pedobacter indicus]